MPDQTIERGAIIDSGTQSVNEGTKAANSKSSSGFIFKLYLWQVQVNSFTYTAHFTISLSYQQLRFLLPVTGYDLLYAAL